MSEEGYDLFIGLLVSLMGILITLYAFQNKPEKESNVFIKSLNIQLKIFGIGCFICGLILAF